jgi:hypothetical protein
MAEAAAPPPGAPGGGPSAMLLYSVGAFGTIGAAGVFIARADMAVFGAAVAFAVFAWSDQREWVALAARWCGGRAGRRGTARPGEPRSVPRSRTAGR